MKLRGVKGHTTAQLAIKHACDGDESYPFEVLDDGWMQHGCC
jgi:hypothetical protein